MLGSRWIRAAAAAAAVFAASFSPATLAQDAQPEADNGKAIWQAAVAAMVRGPNTVQLKDQAQLALPAGYGFVPPKEGAAVMDMLGNQTDERFLGLIFPESEDSNWFVTVDYEPSGYIKDDEAKDGTPTSAAELKRVGGDRGDTLGGNPRTTRRRTAWCGRPRRATSRARTPTPSSTTTRTCWAAKATSR